MRRGFRKSCKLLDCRTVSLTLIYYNINFFLKILSAFVLLLFYFNICIGICDLVCDGITTIGMLSYELAFSVER